MAYDKKRHLRQNIRAIEIALSSTGQLSDSGRKELSLYSGFGGIKQILYPAATDADIAR